MTNETMIIQIRDCFTAGYTMPIFCADYGIKKPLFVGADDSQAPFLWEIYTQFMYERNFSASFAVLNGTLRAIRYSASINSVPPIRLMNITKTDVGAFDAIILLDNRDNGTPKVIQEKIAKLKADNKASPGIFFLDQRGLAGYFVKKAYVEIPLLHYIQRYSGVALVVVNSPGLRRNENNSDYEKFLLDAAENKRSFSLNRLRDQLKAALAEGKTIETPYDFLGYSNQEVYDLLEVTDQRINPDGSTSLNDNEFLGIRNGKRLTANQPEQYKNRIFFVGNCVYYGYGMPYDKTVESHLQNLLNEHNLPYRVENESQFTSFRRQDTFYILDKLDPRPGDVIFVGLGAKTQHLPYFDVGHVLDRPHDYGEVFPDTIHINEIGHKVLAKKFFDELLKTNFFEDVRLNYIYPPPPVAAAPLRHSTREFCRREEVVSERRAG